jgi:hypothetical protein
MWAVTIVLVGCALVAAALPASGSSAPEQTGAAGAHHAWR